jgi:outer membrane cobalamin receptor
MFVAAGGLTAQTGADLPNSIPPVPTVVTVTARATLLTETSPAVTVLRREDIERSHAESAADLLRSARRAWSAKQSA